MPMCSQTCIKDDDAVAAMETARGGSGHGRGHTQPPHHSTGYTKARGTLAGLSASGLAGPLPSTIQLSFHLLAGVIAGGWALVGSK